MALIWSDWSGKLWWSNSYSLFLLLSMPLTQSPLTWLERGLEESSCITVLTNFLDLNPIVYCLIYDSYLLSIWCLKNTLRVHMICKATHLPIMILAVLLEIVRLPSNSTSRQLHLLDVHKLCRPGRPHSADKEKRAARTLRLSFISGEKFFKA